MVMAMGWFRIHWCNQDQESARQKKICTYAEVRNTSTCGVKKMLCKCCVVEIWIGYSENNVILSQNRRNVILMSCCSELLEKCCVNVI